MGLTHLQHASRDQLLNLGCGTWVLHCLHQATVTVTDTDRGRGRGREAECEAERQSASQETEVEREAEAEAKAEATATATHTPQHSTASNTAVTQSEYCCVCESILINAPPSP